MSRDFDAILIGGGHNGLVAAAYLAKAGLQVALFERRALLGGLAATEELLPGFHFNTGLPDAGSFSPEILRDLALDEHGLALIENPAIAFAPRQGGRALTLWRDTQRSAEEIAAFSKADAAAYADYLAQTQQFAVILKAMARLAPPSLRYKPLPLLLDWARVALKLRALGSRQMMEFLRVIPMGAKRYLDEHFENEALKGLLATESIAGLMQGPRAAGTAFMLLYQHSEAPGAIPRRGMGALSQALAAAARSFGAEIHTSSEISRILAQDGRAIGVQLSAGETLSARVVLSGADPRRTLLGLVGAPALEPRIVRRLRALKLRGSTATIHLSLGALPDFPATDDDSLRLSGRIVLCPSLDYAERAYDDAKYGRFSRQPILITRIPSLLDPTLAPEGQHALSITFRYAPYHLRETDWEQARHPLADLAISTLEAYAPGLGKLVLDRKIITPLDYERDYGLSEGGLMQGQMSLDQLLLMRPIPGFAGYRSPLEGLYLCGAGAHPGGGVSGLPGRNAARQVLKEL